jgi:hypothetical protein
MNLSPAIFIILFALATIATAQVPTHTWQVETAQRPAPYALEIIRGESITLAPQYISNGVAASLQGATNATLRYRSADMPDGTYYALSGATTSGTASFAWTSTNCAAATNYLYTIAISGSGLNLRSYGTIKLIGSVGGTSAALPTNATFNTTAYSYIGVFPASVIPTTESTLPTGSIVATNQGVAGQSFFFSCGSPTGVSTGYFATAAGSGDMLVSVYDPNGVQRGVLFTNDARYLSALTNAAAFDSAGSAATATNAIAVHTNNLSNPHQVTTTQIGAVATNDARYLSSLTNAAAFDPVGSAASAAQQAATATNAITVHTNNLSNPHQVTTTQIGAVATNDTRYLAAITNGGAILIAGTDISLSSTAISNGAAITISYTGTGGGGSTGGISAATATGIAYTVVAEWATTGTASKATTVTGAQSNIIAVALTNASAFDASGAASSATNAINSQFLASKGGTTNGQIIAAATNANFATWAASASGAVWAASATNANFATWAKSSTNAQWAQNATNAQLSTWSASSTNANYATVSATASNLVGVQSNIIAMALTNAAAFDASGAATSATNAIDAAFLASKGAITNGLFSVGTSVSNVAGVLYIPTNGLGGGTAGNSSIFSPVDISSYVALGTCTLTAAMGPYLYLVTNAAIVISADSTLTANSIVSGLSLDLFCTNQVTWGSGLTNTTTLSSATTNSILFWKGYGASVMVGR